MEHMFRGGGNREKGLTHDFDPLVPYEHLLECRINNGLWWIRRGRSGLDANIETFTGKALAGSAKRDAGHAAGGVGLAG